MGGAYLDVEVDGNTAFVQGHVRGLRGVFLDFAYFLLILVLYFLLLLSWLFVYPET